MKTKILNKVEGTDLVRVEQDHKISLKYKDEVEKIIEEERENNRNNI